MESLMRARELKPVAIDESLLPFSGKTILDTDLPIEVYLQGDYIAQAEAVNIFCRPTTGEVTVLDLGSGTGMFSDHVYHTVESMKYRAIWIDADAKIMEQGLSQVGFSGDVKCIQEDLDEDKWITKVPDNEILYALVGLLAHYLQPKAYQRLLDVVLRDKLSDSGRLLVVELCGGIDVDRTAESIASELLAYFPSYAHFIAPSPELLTVTVLSPHGESTWALDYLVVCASRIGANSSAGGV
jgi:hypothetical protein